MNLLAIVGTKRKNGLVSTLANKVLEGAKTNGHTTSLINLYDYKLDYCLGCWSCERNGKCVLKDDFNLIFEKVKDADVLVLASPTYWSNVSGIMKTFFDRQCGLAMSHGEGKTLFGKKLPLGFGPRTHMEGKKAIFITSCTTPWPFNVLMDESKNTLRAMNHYTRKIKAKVIGKIIFTDSRFLNVKGKENKYLNKAWKIGLSL
jgi:multimeric flavodoxin WrbA